MHRNTFCSTLRGRGRLRITQPSSSVPTPLPAATQPFSTTTAQQRPADDDNSSLKPATPRERSAAAASKLSALSDNNKAAASPLPGFAPIDARALGASRPAGKAVLSADVINIRSLRRSFPSSDRGRGGGFGGGRGGAGGGGAFAPRSQFGERGRLGARQGGGLRGRGSARGGRGGRGGGGRGGRRRNEDDKDVDGRDGHRDNKLRFSAAEQAWIDSVEQGVDTPYTPSLELDDLVGFGPAVATDCRLGGVELAMRGLRILGGGVPFSRGEGYYVQPRDTRAKVVRGAVFWSDPKEKEWLTEHDGFFGKIPGAFGPTRRAILQTAVQGKYEAPKFAPASDILRTVANYHTKDGTYKAVDGRNFDEKLRTLLPGQKPAGKGAASQPKKASA